MKIFERCAASFLGVALFGAMLFVLAPLARPAELTPQEKKLIPLARQEGAVTILNPVFQEPTAKALRAAFIKRYGLGEDFEFNNVRKGTGACVATARQEIKADKITNDVIMVVGSAFFHAAAERGAFLKLDSGYWQNYEETVKNAGQYSNYPYVLTVYPYTFIPVWNAGCAGMEDVNITSYADLLNPAFKGKTIVSDITKSGSYSATTVGLMEAGFDIFGFWQKYEEITDPIVMFRTEPKMQTLISCERPIDMWNVPGRVFQNVQKKPELAKTLRWGTYKEGQVMLGQHMAVFKGAPHPNAGKLLVEFLLSKEGNDVVIGHEVIFTFLKGYTPPASVQRYVQDPSKMKLLGLKDWVEAGTQFKEIRDRWSQIFR